MYAVIRLKGMVNIKAPVAKTMKMLRLNKKHHCILLQPTKQNIGMINRAKNCLTWGEINEEELTKLLRKRGRIPGNKRFTEEYSEEKAKKTIKDIAKELSEAKLKINDIPGLKPVFRLRPPKKGLEVKGMKKEFSMGGSFGYRGKEINSLLKRMI
jgi:large subunit ribosomal protein L30